MIADGPLSSRLQLDRLAGLAALAGVAALGIALVSDPERAWPSLLLHATWLLSLTLGSAFFLATQYLTKAGWSVAIRRIPEAMTACVPGAAVLLLPVLLGIQHLYHWGHREAVAHDPLLAEKAPYLNPVDFAARLLVILALWSLFAVLLVRASRRTRDVAGWQRAIRISGVFIPVFAVTLSVASFDWLMSVEPHWFSTIYAVYVFSGVFVGAVAAITVGVLLSSGYGGPLEDVVHQGHLHDLGKLLFAFSTFWAYVWVSQYLLIWYGNIPEEATHYVLRTQDPWLGLFALNMFVNWVVPFIALLSAKAKRSRRILGAVAGLLLLGRWLDFRLLIVPPLVEHATVPWWEPVVFLGAVAWLGLGFRFALRRAPPVPQHDPLLAESLQQY